MMRRFILACLFSMLAGSVFAGMGEGGATMTLNGNAPVDNISNDACISGSNGNCVGRALAWDKGTTSYYPYALYRMKSDNCVGSDGGYPGTQIICPLAGTGSMTVYPSATPGCQGIIRYMLVTPSVPGLTCAQMISTLDTNEIAEADETIYPGQ